MTAVVADTHALLWYLNNSPRLSAMARSALENAEQSGSPMYVASITVVELRYLVEKGTITEADYQTVLAMLKDPATAPTIAPLDLDLADKVSRVKRLVVPDMPDRIIAATALGLCLPLVTCDTNIRALTNLTTVW
jgi:PIN domain nuclease of toxin-antitoxin system